jgi:O-antigen ligase
MKTTSEATAAPGRRWGADLAVLGVGALLTIAFAWGLAVRPLPAAAALLLLVAAAGVALFHDELATLRLAPVLAGLALLLPLAAILGPAAGLPAFPQLFAFRVLLVGVVVVGVPVALLADLRTAGRSRWRPALPLALWAGWLCIALLWAPDKAAGLRYLALLGTMLAVVAAAAAAGVSRRRLRLFGVTMIVAYLAIVGFTVLEYTIGYRLPTSRLLLDDGSQSYAVTSVFHNQNDLATYLAICWPFLLCVPFFTRRLRWLALAVVLTVPGALAFVRTGSRSSLLAAGIATFVALILLVRPGAWLQTRRAWALGALLGIGLLVGAGFLLFNESESPMLRQFRLSGLVRDVSASKGSGDIRTTLYERGLTIAGGSLLLGVGPGQTPGIITSGTSAVEIGNLHNWWLEVYAEGGLVGLAFTLTFIVVLLGGLLRCARAPGDPFLRYLATCTFAALVGFAIGALGPSRSLAFAPMWALFGLALAILAMPPNGADPTPAADRAPAADPEPVNADGGVVPVNLP